MIPAIYPSIRYTENKRDGATKPDPLKYIRENAENNPQHAANVLTNQLQTTPDQISRIAETYQLTIQLLPWFVEHNIKSAIQPLLNPKSPLQVDLTIALAKRKPALAKRKITLAKRHQSFVVGMDYLTKGLLASRKDEKDRKKIQTAMTTSLFLPYALDFYNKRLTEDFLLTQSEEATELVNNVIAKETCRLIFDEESHTVLKKFCEDLLDVWTEAIKKEEPSTNELRAHHKSLGAAIGTLVEQVDQLQINRDVTQLPPRNYQEKLSAFRESFTKLALENPDTRTLQRGTTGQFREFFAYLVDDAIRLLGPPPCAYDFRAMGSFAREEPCPYSDLELLLIIADEAEKGYFQQLMGLLNLQILSLGESEYSNVTMNGLRYLSLRQEPHRGLVLDGNPALDDRFIGTAENLAKLQTSGGDRLQLTAKKSTSLKSSVAGNQDPLNYQVHLKAVLSEQLRKKHALASMKERYDAFIKKAYQMPQLVDLKKDFVEPLNHLLGDLAIYFGIEESNTLDILNKLQGRFSSNTVDLLKEAVTVVYHLRCTLHHDNQHQEEHTQYTEQLQEIYLLLLKPLYDTLASLVGEQKTVEEIFQELDLVDVAARTLLKNPQRRVIKSIAKHANPEYHAAYYRILVEKIPVKLGSLLEVYWANTRQDNSKAVIANMADSSGMRLFYLHRQEELKASLLAIVSDQPNSAGVQVFSSHWEGGRYLNGDVANEILSADGQIRRKADGGPYSHNVWAASGPGLHFKQFPEHPYMEFAIHNLLTRIYGELSPPTELVRFAVKGQSYPVLVSRTIFGKTLREGNWPQELEAESWDRWAWLQICSVLTKPADGLAANYVFGPNNTIYSVDNDISFAEPVVRTAPILNFFYTYNVHFISALFCVYQQKKISRKVLEDFIKLNPKKILPAWLDDIAEKQKEQMGLFTEEEHLRMQFLLRPFTITTLYLQWEMLQNFFKKVLDEKKEIKGLDLVKHLITLRTQYGKVDFPGEYVYQQYKRVEAGNSINENLSQIRKSTAQSMSSAHSSIACMGRILTDQEIRESKSVCTVKDAQKELQAIMHRSMEQMIAQGKVEEDFSGLDLADQTERLKQLSSLIREQKLFSVSLKGCKVVGGATLLPFLSNALFHLKLDGCSELTNQDLIEIEQRSPHLKELHLIGCRKITSVGRPGSSFFSSSIREEFRGYIEAEFAIFEDLELLEIRSCPNLRRIYLIVPKITSLNLRADPKLTELRLLSTTPLMARAIIEGTNLSESKAFRQTITKSFDHYLISWIRVYLAGKDALGISAYEYGTLQDKALQILQRFALAKFVQRFAGQKLTFHYCSNLRTVKIVANRKEFFWNFLEGQEVEFASLNQAAGAFLQWEEFDDLMDPPNEEFTKSFKKKSENALKADKKLKEKTRKKSHKQSQRDLPLSMAMMIAMDDYLHFREVFNGQSDHHEKATQKAVEKLLLIQGGNKGQEPLLKIIKNFHENTTH